MDMFALEYSAFLHLIYAKLRRLGKVIRNSEARFPGYEFFTEALFRTLSIK
jgi:hypothetical protein